MIATLLLLAVFGAADVDIDRARHHPGVVIEGTRPKPGGPGAPGPVGTVPGVDPPTLGDRIAEEGRRHCPRRGVAGFPCFPSEPAAPGEDPGGEAPRGPSPEEIERAVREVDLPALAVVAEPADTTLVNLPTNLYTSAPEIEEDVSLLGVAVRIRATPASFTWHHGDGTQQTTSDPGTPYPSLTVTHRYLRAAATVELRVDVGYRVEYSLDGGEWTSLDEPVVATGPSTPLTVRAAEPVLTSP